MLYVMLTRYPKEGLLKAKCIVPLTTFTGDLRCLRWDKRYEPIYFIYLLSFVLFQGAPTSEHSSCDSEHMLYNSIASTNSARTNDKVPVARMGAHWLKS